MKKKNSKLRSRAEVAALMKALYGKDEVKDDCKGCDSEREPGTEGTCEMADFSPHVEKLLLQD